jgi:hypothetical protein
VGRVSSDGIAIRYGLDGPGIESRWRRDFPNPSRTALWPTQPTIQRVTGLIPGVKRPGRGVAHPPPYSADVKATTLLPRRAFRVGYRVNFTSTFSIYQGIFHGDKAAVTSS